MRERLGVSVKTTSSPYQVGRRVRVHKDITTIPPLPGYIGTVKEVIPIYADNTIGYNLLLEGDPRPSRVWFFLQDQLTDASTAASDTRSL